jgi:hypothetical protein
MIAHSLMIGGIAMTVLTPVFTLLVYWLVERDMRKHTHKSHPHK